jgi:hypothetical protein
MGMVFRHTEVQRYEMIIRLSGGEKKPGSRLSCWRLASATGWREMNAEKFGMQKREICE